MHQLLNNNGLLVGVLFNRTFEINPPFGGNKVEYLNLFNQAFIINKFDTCYNSSIPRKNTELFIECKKNDAVIVDLHEFDGITCTGCMNTLTRKFEQLPSILNASISIDYTTILIVSNAPISLQTLQSEIAYEAKFFTQKNQIK